MSYDYERYDGKRIVVDGEIIGLLAMEFGHEVEQVYEEYHAEPALTEEQEIQAESYRKSLCDALRAQYKRVDDLLTDNEKLRELAQDMGELLDVLSECELACKHYHDGCIDDCYYVNARRELGVEVD